MAAAEDLEQTEANVAAGTADGDDVPVEDADSQAVDPAGKEA